MARPINKCERGVATVEYVVLAAVLALTAYAAIQTLGRKSADAFCLAGSRGGDQDSTMCLAAPDIAQDSPSAGEDTVGGGPVNEIEEPSDSDSATPIPTATTCLPPIKYCPGTAMICLLNEVECFYDCSFCGPNPQDQ